MGFEVVSPKPHPFGAKEAHRSDVSFIEAICSHHLTLRGTQSVLVEGHIHSQNMR